MFDHRLKCHIVAFGALLAAAFVPGTIAFAADEAGPPSHQADPTAISAHDAGMDLALPDSPMTAPTYVRVLDEVQRLRAQHGAYAPELRDALLQLGLAYREAGERAQAADAFAQALYVARAHHGLYSLEQVPVLERLIEENRALGRGDDVLNNYQLLYWVNKRHFGDNDPRTLPYIDRIAQAFIGITHGGLQFESAIDVRPVTTLLDKAVTIVESHYGERDPLLVDVLSRVAQVNYSLAVQTGKLPEYRALDRGPMRRVVSLDQQTLTAFALISETETRGQDALKRIRDIYEAVAGGHPDASAYARAYIRIQQGDWKQMYGSGDGSREYAEAYRLLQDTGRADAYIANFFAQPRILPAPAIAISDAAAPPAREAAASAAPVIELAFDVTAKGRVRNVELTDVPPGMEDEAKQLETNMEFQRFRPKIVDGKPVTMRVSQRSVVDGQGRVFLLDRAVDRVYASMLPQRSSEVNLGASAFE